MSFRDVGNQFGLIAGQLDIRLLKNPDTGYPAGYPVGSDTGNPAGYPAKHKDH
jgi:hypothetical protein